MDKTVVSQATDMGSIPITPINGELLKWIKREAFQASSKYVSAWREFKSRTRHLAPVD